MNWLVLAQILLSVGYVWHLVRIYSCKDVPLYLKALIFSTWMLSFGIVFLLPLDIYYSITASESEENIARITLIWKIVYWLNFVITWLLLPIAQEYELAGQFEWKAKLKRSLLNNLIIYALFGVIGGGFLVYLIFRGNFDFNELMSILVAASNVFGMILVVVLLSHGIVQIPKKLWREKKYEQTLKENQYNASVIAAERQQLLHELELKVKEIMAFQRKNGSTVQSETILALVPQQLLKNWQRSVPQFEEINIINVHKQMKRMMLDLSRLDSKWEQLMIDTFRIEDIIKDMNSVDHQIESTLFHQFSCNIINKLVWLWYCRIKLFLYPVLCVLLAIFATAVVLAEISVFSSLFQVLNIFRLVRNLNTFIAIDICTLIPLFYISFCVFYGLFKLKLAGYYGLYRQHTDAPSLIFSALNCSRVSTPLCYNFLQIVDVQDSAFVNVMGTVDIAPVFGRTFNFVFPMLLLLLIVFNAFDIYSRVFKAVGIQRFQFDQENPSQESIQDGRKRLQKARADIEHKILNSHSKNLADYHSYQLDVLNAQMVPSVTTSDKVSSDNLNQPKQYFNKFNQAGLVLKIIDL